MDPIYDGPPPDPFEDPLDNPSNPSATTPFDDPWISGQSLSQMLALELMLAASPSECPRCGHSSFIYAALRFCAFDCPENMVQARQSD